MTTTYVGRPLTSASGDRIGKITDVISDPNGFEPEWLTVKTGVLRREHLVPIVAVEERGGDVVTTLDAEVIKHAPVSPDHTRPSDAERRALYEHFGLPERPLGQEFGTS
jgi:uncharacterized protein YrrD